MVENTYTQLKGKTKNIKNFDMQKMIFNEDIKYFNQDRFDHPEMLNKGHQFFDVSNELKNDLIPFSRNPKTQITKQNRTKDSNYISSNNYFIPSMSNTGTNFFSK